MKVLYLDFDGVLHPDEVYWEASRGAYLEERLVEAGHSLFEHAGLLQELLDPYPDVRVVLSTSWVLRYGVDGAASRLPPALARRCIGATAPAAGGDEAFDAMPRGMQVVADVGRRRPKTWLALDDDPDGWPLLVGDNVVLADRRHGISAPHVLGRLRLRLNRYL